MYEAEADLYVAHDTHPDIMDEYEEHDKGEDKLCLEVIALADVLLEHRRPEAQLTFEDFVVPEPDDAVVRVQESSIGKALLAGPDTQFAIESDGSYYPILDIRRKDLALRGISVRAWGWNYPRVAMTNGPGEPYRYPEHLLQFPSNEQDHTRQLDIRFSYSHPSARAVVEEIHLYTTDRTARLSSQFWVSAYAETGYEGHGGKQIEATDESMLEFLELVARIVGDDPESYTEWYERKLVDLLRIYEGTQEGKKMNELSELLWPAQALYEIAERPREELAEETIETALRRDEVQRSMALALLDEQINYWHELRTKHAADGFDG